MWDDELDPVPPVSSNPSKGSNDGSSSFSQRNGICIGRGRGFGNMSSLKSALPQPGSNEASYNANDSDWQEDNSGWNEGGSSTFQSTDSGWNESSAPNCTDSWQNNTDDYKPSKYGGGRENSYRSSSDRACFKCNQEGHFSRNCPVSQINKRFTSSKGGSRTCNKCGEEGHFARECPSGGGNYGGARTCHKCNEEGHIARDCPNSGSNDRYGGRTCHKCNEEGHMARDCPSGGSNERYGNARTCHKCNEEGHIARDCPNSGSNSMGGSRSFVRRSEGSSSRDYSGRGGGGSRTCNKCGEEGHIARDCTSSNSDDRSGSGCRNCGEEGHFAKDCTKPKIGPDGKPRAPLYIPPELPEDENSIFEAVTTGINFSKHDTIPVDVTGRDAPKPIRSFEESGLSKHLLQNVKKSGYEVPTPVQKYAMPVIMSKRDLMACAETGSGKTAAFLLPIIHSMVTDSQLVNNANKEVQEPLAVVLSPTRELAIQIMSEARKFAYDTVVKVDVVYGGTSTSYQSSRIKKGLHVLVATPGRLLDFVEKGKISLSKVKYFVLDEADRMLDMGFMPSVERMAENMPQKGQRQTLLFSATFAEEIQRLAGKFLDDYLFLTVGVVGGANTDVEQRFFKVGQYEKRDKLMEILQESGTNRVLVFVELKRTADFLASYTSQRNIPTTSIHGDRLQKEREEALHDFRTGRMPVLVATAVAARGLDIKDVCHVINYDLPKSIDEYVHRIGRTGRVGNLGKATSFYDTQADQPLARSLKKILIDANQEIPDWLHEEAQQAVGTTLQYGRSNFGGRDFRSQGGRSTFEDSAADTGAANSENFSQPVDTDEIWD